MYLKANNKFFLYILIILSGLLLSRCNPARHLEEHQYLLSKNKVLVDGKNTKDRELHNFIKQKPNKKFLKLFPVYLGLYNLSNQTEEDSWLKRIGEAPSILNHRLSKKSAKQLELHFKNRGYFDSRVTNQLVPKRKKAQNIFSITKGDRYTISKIQYLNIDNEKLVEAINNQKSASLLKKGKYYDFELLQEERKRIAHALQNSGYHQLSKEFIHFIADTNQANNTVDLSLLIKDRERLINGVLIEEKHRSGFISKVYVHLENQNSLQRDTLIIEGLHFIFSETKFNTSRLLEKIRFRPGLAYSKDLLDVSYQAISELKNFKKIDFEFIPVSSLEDQEYLDVHIYLSPGKKLAYSLETEATYNQILGEGISGKASLSHYNLFRGAEHLRLTFKGSSNFNDIKESGGELSLTIPSLISPFNVDRIFSNKSRTKSVFSIAVSEQQRPEFVRNSILARIGYQWKSKDFSRHKLSLFNISYVNFEGDSTNLSEISEYLIAKDYSNHLIPTSSYTYTYNNQNLNKLSSHSFFRLHIESSGSVFGALAKPLNFEQLADDEGNLILQDNGEPIYTLNLWSKSNIFTQYIKTSLDYRYYWEIDQKNSLAFRLMGGIAYGYGNTNQVPFHKKFLAGGANDLRGWKAFKRPAGTMAASDTLFSGGVKLLTSIEYRFTLIRKLKAAVFMDAGNIWELENNNEKYKDANFQWDQFHQEIAMDVGFGLRYDFQYFVFRSDLGFPIREPSEAIKWKPERINWQHAQINIGLGYPF